MRRIINGLIIIWLMVICYFGNAYGADMKFEGTFNMNTIQGCCESSLESILGNDNGWYINLHDVTIQHDVSPFPDFQWEQEKISKVYSSSFDFYFTGDDETLLNSEVGQGFTQGGPGGRFLEFSDSGRWIFTIQPPDTSDGVYFQVYGESSNISLDNEGFPIIDSISIDNATTILFDRRGEIDENVISANNGTFAIVPEPVSSILFVAGGAFLAGLRLIKRKKKA